MERRRGEMGTGAADVAARRSDRVLAKPDAGGTYTVRLKFPAKPTFRRTRATDERLVVSGDSSPMERQAGQKAGWASALEDSL